MLLIFILAVLAGPLLYRMGAFAFQIYLAYLAGGVVTWFVPFAGWGHDLHFIASIAAFIGLRILVRTPAEAI